MVPVAAILGGATALASAVSSIVSLQQSKKLAQEADAEIKRMMGMEETDKMAALQSPDVSSLRLQKIGQQVATGTRTLQEMGQEAAIGGVANLYQATAQEGASAVTEQNAINAQIAAMKAQNAQEVAYRNLARKYGISALELEGLRAAESDRYSQFLAGISGVAAGGGMALEDIIGSSDPYKYLSKEEKQKLGIS